MVDPRAIFAALRDALHDAQPATWPDRGFSAPAHSLVSQPDQWIQLQSRNFRDFCFHVTGYPVSSNAYCYYALDAEILLYYPHSVATDELQAILIEDAVTIQNDIGRHPEHWGGADAVSFLQQQPYIWTTVSDDNGEGIATVYAVPLHIEVKI